MERFRRIAFPILHLFRIWLTAAKLLAVATGKTVPACEGAKRHPVQDD